MRIEEPQIEYVQPDVNESSMADPPPNMNARPDVLTFEKNNTGTQRGRWKLVDSLGFSHNVKRKHVQ